MPVLVRAALLSPDFSNAYLARYEAALSLSLQDNQSSGRGWRETKRRTSKVARITSSCVLPKALAVTAAVTRGCAAWMVMVGLDRCTSDSGSFDPTCARHNRVGPPAHDEGGVALAAYGRVSAVRGVRY